MLGVHGNPEGPQSGLKDMRSERHARIWVQRGEMVPWGAVFPNWEPGWPVATLFRLPDWEVGSGRRELVDARGHWVADEIAGSWLMANPFKMFWGISSGDGETYLSWCRSVAALGGFGSRRGGAAAEVDRKLDAGR